jgi:membrane fusion protein, multidrug efflux system
MTPRAALLSIVCLVAVLGAAGACGGGASTSEAPPAEPQTDVPVTVTPIVRTTLHRYVTGWGTVEPEPAQDGRPPASATVATPVAGLISGIQGSEGDRVRQGAILFRLDSRVADVAVQRAQQAVRFAQGVVERQEQLGPGEATSQRAYQDARQQLAAAQNELAAAELQRRLLDIPAPIDGTITHLNATLGDAVDPSTALADMVDLTRLVANAAVRSVDVQHIRRGQVAALSPGTAAGAATSATPPAGATGTVTYIAPQVDSATDTVLVRVAVPASSGLRPGQFVDVRIAAEERRNQLAVPVESLVQGPEGPEIALVEGDTATRTRVTPGLRDGALVEVQGDGLREGQSVVVQGAYGLPPKSKIRILSR